MADGAEHPKEKASPPLEASAIVLLLFYILVTVAGHADTDLIRPDTQVSLQAASEKVNLPSGWLFSPFLGLKLPIFWFYVLAPLFVLALHVELLRIRPAAEDVWATALRFAGNFLAPVALFLLLWKFAPYAHARPPELPGLSVGLALSYFLATALLLDAALLLYPYLAPPETDRQIMPASRQSLGRIGAALLALRHAALLWLIALGLVTLLEVALSLSRVELISARPFGVSATTFIISAGVLLGAAAGLALVLLRWIRTARGSFLVFTPRVASKEAAPMPIYAILFAVLLIGVGLPDFGRPLNLTGARLAAAEPSEAIMAAMIVAAKNREPDKTRREAWKHFGRGLDYTRWQFASASFDGAVMPLIRLDRANLSDASLIRADLTDASLVGTILRGTTLDEADLRGADLTCVNNNDPCVALVQAPATEQRALGTQPQPTPGTQSQSPRNGRQVCESAGRGGPKLNKAHFFEATMERADLSNASLRQANLVGIKTIQGTLLSGSLRAILQDRLAA